MTGTTEAKGPFKQLDPVKLRQEAEAKGNKRSTMNNETITNGEKNLLTWGSQQTKQRRRSNDSRSSDSPAPPPGGRSDTRSPRPSSHGRPTSGARGSGTPSAGPPTSRRSWPTAPTSRRSAESSCASAPTSSRPSPSRCGSRPRRPGLAPITSTS